MKLFSFFTKTIHFKSLDELERFVEHCSKFYVHPTDFLNSHGFPLYDEFRDSPLDSNNVYGSPLEFDINEDQLTVSISGEGGLSIAVIKDTHGYVETSPVMGNLIKDVLGERFYAEHPNFEIYLVTEDTATGEESTEIITLAQFYAPKGKADCDNLKQHIRTIQLQIKHLQQQEAEMQQQLQKLEKQLKDDEDEEYSLPF